MIVALLWLLATAISLTCAIVALQNHANVRNVLVFLVAFIVSCACSAMFYVTADAWRSAYSHSTTIQR